jgi:hypothetical protein
MVEESDNPFVLYQSPDWFDHLTDTGLEGQSFLAYSLGVDDHDSAFVPITIDRQQVSLRLARGFVLPSPAVMTVRIWGGRPMMPETPAAINGLFETLLERFPSIEGLDLFGVGEDSGFIRALARACAGRRDFVVERREGLERIDLISLPRTFDEFLGRYGSKKRYNIRRQIRLARDSARGDLVLERVEHPKDVTGFLESIAVVNGLAGQSHPAEEQVRLRDLAKRGLLRGYVLRAEGRPIACLMGKQLGQTYLIDWTRYDRVFRTFSPGTTLLHLAIEDLIMERPGALINLGYGSAKSSFRSTNESHPYPSFLLIKRTRTWRCILGLRATLRAVARVFGSILRALRRGGKSHDRVLQTCKRSLVEIADIAFVANMPNHF